MAYCLILYGGWEGGNLSSSTNYFIGGDNYNSTRAGLSGAPGYGNTSVEVPVSGTIKYVYVKVRLAGPGTAGQTVSHFIRINDTTDVGQIDIADYSAVTQDGFSTPSTAVVAGDLIALKIVTPAWLSPPGGVRWYCLVYIE